MKIFNLLLFIYFRLLISQPLMNDTPITITKFWYQEPEGYTYPISINVPDGEFLNNEIPICILLHGNGGNGQGMLSSFISILPNHALVAPTGYLNSWNISDEQSNAPDVQMIEDLINILQTFSNINAQKIRILGVSNGAALANRIFIENTNSGVDKFCTIVSQLSEAQYHENNFFYPSGLTGGTDIYDGYNTQTIPLSDRKYLSICNQNDPLIPYMGGPSVGVNFLHAEYAAFIIAQSQGYTGIQIEIGLQIGNSNIFEYNYLNGSVIHLKGDAGHGFNSIQMEFITQFFDQLLGDLNDDDIIDIIDIILMVNLILNNNSNPFADFNSDNQVNILDIILMVNLILD